MHCPCSSKYNRTHRYDSSGNRIISLPFSSPATRYVKRDTQYDIACKKLGCSFVRGYLHPDPSNCCISAPYRNPIAGCRTYLDCSGCPKAAINNVYKDNWAKSCAFPTSDPPVCYSPVIKKTQNKNGLMDYEYSYSTRQYLNRRCRTYKQQTLNFTSNTAADPSGTECCSNKYQANCACAPDCSGCRCELIPAVPACKVSNNSCCVTYKRSNQRFNKQGAVSGGSRINRLKYQTILKSQSVTPPTLYQDTPDIFANAVNGSMPVSLYRNTFPQYKKYIAGRRFARGINSGLVFQQPYGIPELTRRDRRTSERRRNALQN